MRIERKWNSPTLAPFVLVVHARAERQLSSWQYWLGNDGARPVLRQTVSRVVSSTEQPPATNTGLLKQSAPRGSLQWQFLKQSAPQRSLKQHSSSQLHGAVSSDIQLDRYSDNDILITEAKAISLSTRFFLQLDLQAWAWCTTDH